MNDKVSSLTICLVTRGRKEYLLEALEGLASLKLGRNEKILVINNGADVYASETLKQFVSEKKEERRLEIIDLNDARPSAFWEIVSKCDSEWVFFPSDDDIVLPGAIDLWKLAVINKPDLVAFCGSARIIDQSSNITGVRIKPDIHGFKNSNKMIANAFFQPPFIWPALFFKKDVIPSEFCQSRYAFDWWVGLNLLSQGEIFTSTDEILMYRNHDHQESNLASKSRKYYEAMIWLSRFCRSETFRIWIASQDDEGLMLFWEHVKEFSPIYGDIRFGTFVLHQIAEALINHSESRDLAALVATDLAFLNGIYFKPNEAWHVSTQKEQKPWSGNFKLESETNLCPKMRDILQFLDASPIKNSILIRCLHSATNSRGIYVDCQSLDSNILQINVDKVINVISQFSDEFGGNELALTPGEFFALKILRKLLNVLPGSLRNLLKRLKHKAVLK